MDTTSESEILNFELKSIWNFLKNNKLTIILVTLIFSVLGLLYSLTIKDEFLAEGKLLPEFQSKNSSFSQLAGLAALAGMDFGNNSGIDAIRPDLYPELLKSKPFFLKLFSENIKDKNNKTLKFSEFYNKEIFTHDVSKENETVKFLGGENYLSYSKNTELKIKNLKERIICNYDKKTGIISISVKMPDPVVAAYVAGYSMEYLKNYIINYRTEKQKKEIDFLEDKLFKAKGKYFNFQEKKAKYSDQMPLNSLKLSSADLERERIDAEYKISSSFYNTLLQKYEEAKLKMQQSIPIIKILDPPVIPNKKSEPNKLLITLVFSLMGFFLSNIYCLLKRS